MAGGATGGRPIRHSSAIKPRLYPLCNDTDSIDIDRAQSVQIGVDRPSEQVFEIGRDGELQRDFDIPEATASITQFEYGTLKIYEALANLATKPAGGFTLPDFDTGRVDLATFEKIDVGLDHELTRYLPKLALSSIGLNIGDPEAIIERTFELAGDDHITLRFDNKAFILKKFTDGTGGAISLDVSDPAPIEDPNVTGRFIFRVFRVRGIANEEIVEGTDWSYDVGDEEVDIVSSTIGDVYKVAYSATTFGTAGDPTGLNDADDTFLKAENATILLIDSVNTNTITQLQSLALTATFERTDQGEIGNSEKILKEVQNRSVTITLNGFIKNASIEEIARDKSQVNWGILNVRDFSNTTTLVVKIFRDRQKTDFAIGYKITNMTFPGVTRDIPVNDFGTKDINFEADNLLITDVEGEL